MLKKIITLLALVSLPVFAMAAEYKQAHIILS